MYPTKSSTFSRGPRACHDEYHLFSHLISGVTFLQWPHGILRLAGGGLWQLATLHEEYGELGVRWREGGGAVVGWLVGWLVGGWVGGWVGGCVWRVGLTVSDWKRIFWIYGIFFWDTKMSNEELRWWWYERGCTKYLLLCFKTPFWGSLLNLRNLIWQRFLTAGLGLVRLAEWLFDFLRRSKLIYTKMKIIMTSWNQNLQCFHPISCVRIYCLEDKKMDAMLASRWLT